MQKNSGADPRPGPAFPPALAVQCGDPVEPTEAQCLGFDHAYAAAKANGAVERVRTLAALNLQLSHSRSSL